MSNTCNRIVVGQAGHGLKFSTAADKWVKVYLENESFIESGSASFAQAFAEALGVIADVELHDLGRAKLRLNSIGRLLSNALTQYDQSMQLGEATGLLEHHASRLRDEGVTANYLRETLETAIQRRMLLAVDGIVDDVAETYESQGYRALMDAYSDMVREVKTLVTEADLSATEPTFEDVVAWQEFSWSVTSRMAKTLVFGQAIAMLNTLTLRFLTSDLAEAL